MGFYLDNGLLLLAEQIAQDQKDLHKIEELQSKSQLKELNDIAVGEFDDDYLVVDDDDADEGRYRWDDDDYMRWRQEKEWDRKRAELDEISHRRAERHQYHNN